MKKVLVTGTAGFIGYHLTELLLSTGEYEVLGLDSINDYYQVDVKYGRLERLGIDRASAERAEKELVVGKQGLKFRRIHLEDKEALSAYYAAEKPDYVVNLAAQAGVRYSLVRPDAYVDANVTGFLNILECCRHHGVEHLIYASTSSVYGLNTKMPFSVEDGVNHPVSLYAATKKANELMAHCYSHLFQIPTSGLRFFTVYGPWGRPDMALFIFTKNILEGKPIEVFNHGEMSRDFTYVGDIVESIRRLLPVTPQGNASWKSAAPDPSTSAGPYRIYNIGNNAPVRLLDFVHAIEKATGKEAIIDMKPLQPGDVPSTFANVESLFAATNFKPATTIEEGVGNFVKWYRDFFGV